MRYLVTGGSGFLGHELIKKLLEQGHSVVSLSRNEGKLVELKEKFPSIEIVVGEVDDMMDVEKAMQGVDGVFHLAAMKHVGLAEQNVLECISTNIIGSMNILEASYRHSPKFVIGISTDKAASRKGVYGTTKFLMERLFSEYEGLNLNTKYRLVRYGNVLYSTGSVLAKWKEKILNGKMVTITEPKATRFFWTVEQAVDLIFECLEKAVDATPYVTTMKSMQMGDLLAAMIRKYATSEIKTEVIGLGVGENLHEIITENGPDSSQAEQFSIEEIMQLI